MPWILGKRTRTKQPATPVGIDWSNPITRGLVDVIDMASSPPRSVILKTPCTSFGTNPAYKSPTLDGMSMDSRAGFGGVYFSRADGMYATAAQTHIAVVEFTEFSATYAGLFSCADSSGGNVSFSVQYMDLSVCRVYPDAVDLISLTPKILNSGINVIGLSGNASGSEVYKNGKLELSGIAAYPTAYSTSKLTLFGERTSSASYSAKGRYVHHLFYNRALNAREHLEIAINPWQIFEPEIVPLWVPVSSAAPQLLAPISDLSAGGWTPSSGGSLYAMLDESPYSDADYIVSSTPSSCEMRVATGADPAVSTGHILRYRLLAGSGSITATLKQGATTIASYGPHTLTGAAQDFEQTLTGGEADSITDYGDLRVVFTAS